MFENVNVDFKIIVGYSLAYKEGVEAFQLSKCKHADLN